MNFLIRKCIKDYSNTEDPKVRERYGKFAGVVGILSNVVLCAMKIVIGILAGSIAIIADGINNLADSASSLMTLIGFKLASMPEDKTHPYGHARYEYLTGLLVSIVIIIVGFSLLRQSIDKVLHPGELVFSLLTVAVLLIAIAIKIWQALFNIKLGKRINSLTLIATGTDSRNDVISTTAVLIALLIGHFSGYNLDGIMGCAVALFIMWSGISLVRETISPLLGEAPDGELVSRLAAHAESYPGVLGIHDLMVHNYGPGKIFVSVHIEVDASAPVLESHDLMDRIERDLDRDFHIHLTCHMDPIVTDDPRISELFHFLQTRIQNIDGLRNIHDLRIVPGPTHTNVIFDCVKEPKCKVSDEEVLHMVNHSIREIDPSYFAVINFDRAYTDTHSSL